jgi:hypothetical protein
LTYYYVTSLVVLLGLVFSAEYIRQRDRKLSPDGSDDLVGACVRFDGYHYRDIASRGYDYDPTKRSTVAFFPAFPLLARVTSAATGLAIEPSLLLVSNVFLAFAFVLFASYMRSRPDPARPSQTGWAILSFGLWPSAFFLHMALAESLFIATALLTLVGIHRRWNPWPTALVAGLATATRPVGVAVAAAFLWHVLSCSPGRFGRRLGRAALLAVPACWGLLAYMAYQHVVFGNALGFAQTQENWTYRLPDLQTDLAEKARALLTLEPIRGVFDVSSPRYWLASASAEDPLFNLFFWNPVVFLASAGLVALGACRKWLTGAEVVLGASLLAIPYLTRSYEMSMASHARFATAVVVIYPVLGRLLDGLPPAMAASAAALSGGLLLCWTALYTAGYAFF